MSETITINTYPIQETIDVTTVNDVTTINVNVVQSSGAVSSVNGQTGDIVLDIPTLTSDLINDSGFITANDFEASNENVVNILAQSPEGQFNRAHGTLVINDKLYIGTREGATSKLLRYNGTTLEESITIPCDTAGVETLCVKSDGTRLYGVRNYASVNYIFDVNPLDFTDINFNVISGVNLFGSPAICTDDTYIYGVENGLNCKFFKVKISDWTTTLTNSWTGRRSGHACAINKVDGVFYATNQTGYQATVNLSDLTFVENDLTSYAQILTDDLAYLPAEFNDFGFNALFIGGENKASGTGLGGIMFDADSGTIYPYDILPTVGIFISLDHLKLYNTSNEGFIQVWDLPSLITSLVTTQPYFSNVYTYRGYGFPNEILETSTALYFTNWDTNKGVVNKCELVAKDKPLITQKEAYYNSLAKANVSDLANKVDKVTGERLINATEITKLSNTSGTNSGDNAVNSLYSGLATSKEDASNKSTSTSDSASTTKFPVWSAIVSYISTILSSYATTSALTSGLATKEPTITGGTTGQYYRGDKSFQTLDKTAVGLANVDNTSDVNKPVSTAQQTELDLKANKADFMVLLNAYVLSNSTSLQKMFNVGSGSGGAFNATANKTYRFRIEFDLTGLSTTSSTISFGFLGTAVITSINYKMNSTKNALATITAANIQSLQTTAGTVVTAATTNATAKGMLSGIIRVSTAGTIIPAVSTSIGVATAQVEVNSYAEFVEIGSNTVTASSNIS